MNRENHTVDSQVTNTTARTFKGSDFWVSNVQMATAAGIGGGIVMLAVAVIILRAHGNVPMATLLLLNSLGVSLCFFFPGDLIAMYPTR